MTAARRCRRLGPGSVRRPYRTAAPAIQTIGHGSGQSPQNPSLLPARRLTGLLAGRIRLALRRALNKHKTVNFCQLIAGSLPGTAPLPPTRAAHGHFAQPRATWGAAVRGCRSPAPSRNSREHAPRDFVASRADSGGNGGSMVRLSRVFGAALGHVPAKQRAGRCAGRNCAMRRGALHTIAA
jgi:hypothetical protein